MKKIPILIALFLTYSVMIFASSNGIISVGLMAKKQSLGASSAIIDLVISNNTEKSVKVLKWSIPQEHRISSDLFDVRLNDEKIRYIGRLVKRGEPTEENYLTLNPKESRIISIDLSDYYDMNQEGDYSVQYKVSPQFKFVKKKVSLDKAKLKAIQKKNNSLKIFSFHYIPANKKQEAKLPAAFEGCSQSRINIINTAHDNAISISDDAALAMNNADRPTSGDRYVEWFGEADVARHDTVQKNFNAIYGALDTKDIIFNCGSSVCDPGTYAFVYRDSPYRIYLCSSFWSAPVTGTDSRAGTIVHEASHFSVVADTYDTDANGNNVYGHTASRNLAISDPNRAVVHADSYEYFAENTPTLTMGQNTSYGSSIRSGFNEYTLSGNDDSYTNLVPIGFTVNFFGLTYTSLYVNNNGNITFDSQLGTYTPFDITSTTRKIIAPFFADVDTRNSANVTYGQGMVNNRLAFAVNWINVGYFNSHSSPVNSLQLVLIDRSDTGSGNFDIEFNYSHIGWETGTASGGSSNGLGGYSARIGFSNGTRKSGTYYEMIGSAINGSFIDGGSHSVVSGKYNSNVLGRYIFKARSGSIQAPSKITPWFTLIL